MEAAYDYAIRRWGGSRSAKDIMVLAEGFRVVLCGGVLEGEVNNGGFFQFFENEVFHEGDPELVALTIESLRAVGAVEHARLLEFASAIIPILHGCDRDNDEEGSVVEHFLKGVELLDDSFFALPDLDDYLLAYIRKHPDAFAH